MSRRIALATVCVLLIVGFTFAQQPTPVIKLTRHEEPPTPPPSPEVLRLVPQTLPGTPSPAPGTIPEPPPPQPPNFHPPVRPLHAPDAPPAHLTMPANAAGPMLSYPMQSNTVPVAPALPPALPPSAWGDEVTIWFRPEALLWWVRSQSLPPLVTTSPPGPPASQAGVLGLDTTTLAVGSQGINGNARFGGRLAAGGWFDAGQAFGFQADYWLLTSNRTLRANSFDGSPLARPFFDVLLGRENSQLVGFPASSTGRVLVSATTSAVEGAGALLREHVLSVADASGHVYWRIDVLGGYRYLRFAEALEIGENFVATSNSTGLMAGTEINSRDLFQTRNVFHGADLGFVSEYRQGPLSLELTTRLAVGYVGQRVRILGNRIVTTPAGSRSETNGGLLALGSNIGTYDRSEPTIIPEVGLNVGWQLNPNLRITAGYNFLYVADLVRPGDQIDRFVNTNLLPPVVGGGPDRPRFAFRESDVWMQGVKLGVELSY